MSGADQPGVECVFGGEGLHMALAALVEVVTTQADFVSPPAVQARFRIDAIRNLVARRSEARQPASLHQGLYG